MLKFYLLVVIQIITESFPISSSGHVQLASCLLEYPQSLISSDIISYLMNIPMVIIIPIFFFPRWWILIRSAGRNWYLIIQLILYGTIAAIMTAIGSFLIRPVLLSIPLYVGFVCTASMLASLYYCSHNTHSKKMSLWYAVLFGLLQTGALLPGLSRFGLIYTAARWSGFSPRKAFEITWLIQWPLLVGVSLLVGTLFLRHAEIMCAIVTVPLMIITIAASYVSYRALQCVYQMILSNQIWRFAWYMIIPLVGSFYCIMAKGLHF